MIAKHAENTALRFCSYSTSWAKAHTNSLHSDHIIYICNNVDVSLCIITEAAMQREQLYRDNAVLLNYGYLIRLNAFLRMPHQCIIAFESEYVCLFAEMQIYCEWRYNLYIKHVQWALQSERQARDSISRVMSMSICVCAHMHVCAFILVYRHCHQRHPLANETHKSKPNFLSFSHARPLSAQKHPIQLLYHQHILASR